ncbi:MAG: class II glutamine amidotransferase [Pelagimonas sp.]|jgi:glutamine amidotransferase|nr:class II glutamine amidotransferase [Pelagimonas sp.]
MCRIAAYQGPDIPLENIVTAPAHSLSAQSHHAEEAKLSVNGDGFGIAWYSPDNFRPGVYRDVLPAWSDANLNNLCRMVRSGLFLAHVRASTVGETSRANCHPFSFQNWSFCHNGQIPAFPQTRRALEAALPDDLYNLRQGSTDSEILFLTLMAHEFPNDPLGALHNVLRLIAAEPGAAPNRITCVLSDGKALYAFRHATDKKAPTLYYSDVLDNGGRAFASEPLCGNHDRWHEVPQDTLVVLKDGVFSDYALWPKVA